MGILSALRLRLSYGQCYTGKLLKYSYFTHINNNNTWLEEGKGVEDRDG